MEAVARRIQDALTKEYQYKRDDELWAEIEDDLNRQMAALQERKKNVEAERRHLQQDLDHNEKSLEKEGTAYGRHMYYDWCQAFHARLPRELRDLIYSYVTLKEPSLCLSAEPDEDEKNLSHSMNQQLEDYFKEEGIDDLVNPALVGHQNAKEMAEYLLSKIDFEISGGNHSERLVPPFFDTNFFGLGVDMFALVEGIQISFDTADRSEGDDGEEISHVNVQFLDILGKLKHKDAVSVRIFRPRSGKRHRILGVLEDIAGWLYSMKNMEFDIQAVTRVDKGRIDFCEHIGSSMDDFEEFKTTWPEDKSDDDAHRTFYDGLVLKDTGSEADD